MTVCLEIREPGNPYGRQKNGWRESGMQVIRNFEQKASKAGARLGRGAYRRAYRACTFMW